MKKKKGKHIIGFKRCCTKEHCSECISRLNGRVLKLLPEINAYVVELASDDMSPVNLTQDVTYFEKSQRLSLPNKPDVISEMSRRSLKRTNKMNRNRAVPNDSLYDEQWGLKKIRCPKGWRKARKKSTKFVVGVLDSGIDFTHPDLKNKVIIKKNFTNARNKLDYYGHGTFVAGIIGAVTNNSYGIAGVSHNSIKLASIKVINDKGWGYDYWVAKGIIFAVNAGIPILNMSIGFYENSSVISEAIKYATDRGVVVIAAAGNDGANLRIYPAAYTNVISVAAINPSGQKASFSSFGSDWVDMAAPGTNILSTLPSYQNEFGQTYFGISSGTSFSAPFVSGVAGLIKATYRNSAGANEITQRLFRTRSIPGVGSYYKYGLVDVPKSLK